MEGWVVFSAVGFMMCCGFSSVLVILFCASQLELLVVPKCVPMDLICFEMALVSKKVRNSGVTQTPTVGH